MFLLNHISPPLLLYPRTLHTFCQLHQNMTSTKGICRPCKTLESKCSQKQMLRQRFKSKYLGAGVGEEEVRQGREGSEWWYMVLYRASHLGGQLELAAARAAETEKNVPQCFPSWGRQEFISRLLSITGAGEAALKGHSFPALWQVSPASHRQWAPVTKVSS